ncbi:hypothetical protein [Ruegeria meonggei]|uniref:Uncharacterized protein n=1 Tax=Ruegeria meonggei TaxID=1446476 RepID=A0A1X7ACT0_9RHOB|nr:hypothetical protein [Ruegeria meonggei]SLN75828.1 hypothetical protein RUM8411_04271 [Ruegeria meonggei]
MNDETLETIEAILANHSEGMRVYLRSNWTYDPDAFLRLYLGHGYCYQPVDGFPSKVDMLYQADTAG